MKIELETSMRLISLILIISRNSTFLILNYNFVSALSSSIQTQISLKNVMILF